MHWLQRCRKHLSGFRLHWSWETSNATSDGGDFQLDSNSWYVRVGVAQKVQAPKKWKNIYFQKKCRRIDLFLLYIYSPNDAVLNIKEFFLKSSVRSEKVGNSTHVLISDPTFSELRRNFRNLTCLLLEADLIRLAAGQILEVRAFDQP